MSILPPCIRAVRDDPLRAILVLGVVLRIVAYLWNREYWMDEGSLLGNIEGKAVFDFSDHLGGDQLAPLGFLIVERMLVRSAGQFRLCHAVRPAALRNRLALALQVAGPALAFRPRGAGGDGPVRVLGRPGLLLERGQALRERPGHRPGALVLASSLIGQAGERAEDWRPSACSRWRLPGSPFPRCSSWPDAG